MKKLLWVFVGSLVLSTQAAGLNCSKAQSKVERLICDERKNPDLYSLDSRLNAYYSEVIQQANSQSPIADQKKWLTAVRNLCGDAQCLRKAYQSRVSELQTSATLCKADEVVIYSCTLPGRKVMSLCASQDATPYAGYMQYRMGRSQKDLERQFPEQ